MGHGVTPMNRRNLLWIAAAALVALWWWQRENHGAVLPVAEDPVRLSLTNSTLYQYDADGIQVSVLHSPQAEHLKDGSDRLHQPEMRVRLKNGERSLRAALAERNAAKNRITLSGGVVGEQTSGTHHYQITTASLHYHPEQQQAETADPITLTSETSRTEAVGARWDMNTNHFTLDHNLKSTYEPAP